MQAEVVRDQAGAETVRANVAREEAAVAQTAAEAKALAEDAKADLAQALPALQAAIDSLSALNKGAERALEVLLWHALLCGGSQQRCWQRSRRGCDRDQVHDQAAAAGAARHGGVPDHVRTAA